MRKVMTVGMVLAFLTSAQAATFTGAGGDTLFHNPTNWSTGVVPASAAQESFAVQESVTIDFDADTWAYLDANNLLNSSTQYRGVNRLLTGNLRAARTQVLNFDQGDGHELLWTGNSSMYIAEKNQGGSTTVNIISGANIFEANPFRVGFEANTHGILNVSGGHFAIGRNRMEVGYTDGTGEVNITGGRFTTRERLYIGSLGSFSVAGTAATEIGIGSQSSVDGAWYQSGLLDIGIDETATGVTRILIDETDGTAGSGYDGNVTFDAGSLLNVGFLGSDNLGTFTVMEWEGTVTGAGNLAFAPGVDTSVWSFNVDETNKILTVTAIPEPATLGLIALFGGGMLFVRRKFMM